MLYEGGDKLTGLIYPLPRQDLTGDPFLPSSDPPSFGLITFNRVPLPPYLSLPSPSSPYNPVYIIFTMDLWLMRSKEGRGRGLKNKKREEERGERKRESESFRTAWSADREKGRGRGTEGRKRGRRGGGESKRIAGILLPRIIRPILRLICQLSNSLPLSVLRLRLKRTKRLPAIY